MTLKKQLVIHMVYNLIAFAIIFSIFGLIVASMFKFITYSSLDKELLDTANVFINDGKKMEAISEYFLEDKYADFEIFEKELRDIRDYNLARKVTNPKYTVIIMMI